MKAFLASDFRGILYENELYLPPKAYMIYKRYADAFGSLILCSRFERVESLPPSYLEAKFINEIIIIDSLKKALMHDYDAIISDKMRRCDLVIGRLPSIIGYRAFDCAHRLEKKFLAECMGDPWASLWNHSFLGKLIAGYMHCKMKIIVKQSDYVIYVTERYLQEKFPNKNKTINASNVEINNVSNVVLNKRINKIKNFNPKDFSLMTSAGVNVRAKGHKYVIQAMKKLKDKDIMINYYLAGGGDQTYLKKVAKRNNLENQVHFLGELSMDNVFAMIDRIDIYIQPSLQEGLPRAVIEAMSRGCPCLGSDTAGIPELLDNECIFKSKSTDSIVKSILQIIHKDLTVYAKNNFERSKCYLSNVLDKKRNDYFDLIKEDIS